MRSKEIIKKLNNLVDLLQDDIEETKKNEDVQGFEHHMKALNEIKFALIMSHRHIVDYVESKNEPQP